MPLARTCRQCVLAGISPVELQSTADGWTGLLAALWLLPGFGSNAAAVESCLADVLAASDCVGDTAVG